MTFSLIIPIQLSKSQTGLTLVARTYDPETGADISDDITTGFVERVNGRYDFTADALPDNQAVGVRFISGADEVASTVLNVSDVYAILAMKAKLDALNVDTTITVAVAVDPVTGDVTIYRGDSYLTTTPKGALVWTEVTGLWLPYIGKTAVFTARHYKDKAGASRDSSVMPISKSAVIANTTGNTCTVTVELDSEDTESIADKYTSEADQGAWFFDVQAAYATHEDETLLSGQLTLLMDVSPPSA